MDLVKKKKLLVEKITFIMNSLGVKWFYCFGNLLEFVNSRGQEISFDYDIDLGIIYGSISDDAIIGAFRSNGYDVDSRIINDVDKSLLNIHFKANEPDMIDTPMIDIYMWVRHKNYLYHTYDFYKEGKSIPSKYVFKGVRSYLIEPSKEEINRIRQRDNYLSEDGTWLYEMYGECSGYLYKCPYSYGALLDIWHPGWCFPDYDKSQSKTIHPLSDRVELKTCADWCKV